MARKRSGSLVRRASGWRGSVRETLSDGATRRKWVDLNTPNKGLARRRLAALVARLERGEPLPDLVDEKAVELRVSEFAATYYPTREALKKKHWKDEQRWFKSYIEPHIGGELLGDVEGSDITALLLDAVKRGRPLESVKKIRVECFRLFRAAKTAKHIASNPVYEAETPELDEQGKARVILTDDEFVRYVLHPDGLPANKKLGTVDRELKILAILARTTGGQRTSDLHALDWSTVDRVHFDRILIVRPKTARQKKKRDNEAVYVVPEVARPFLAAWHVEQGRPDKGPVFPVRRGKRFGEGHERKGKASYAERLRRDLLRAGVDRHELHHETDRTLPTDFHSFRRNFATALKRAHVDAREAMRLTAHTSFETHQGYVLDDGPIPAPPDAALPMLPAPIGCGLLPMRVSEIHDPGSGWQDLNLQQPAPKAFHSLDTGGKAGTSATSDGGARPSRSAASATIGCNAATDPIALPLSVGAELRALIRAAMEALPKQAVTSLRLLQDALSVIDATEAASEPKSA